MGRRVGCSPGSGFGLSKWLLTPRQAGVGDLGAGANQDAAVSDQWRGIALIRNGRSGLLGRSALQV